MSDREQIAQTSSPEEQQSARINPGLAWTLVIWFLATVFLFPVVQHVKEIKPKESDSAAVDIASVLGGYELPQCYQVIKMLPSYQEVTSIRGVRDLLGVLPTLKELGDYEDGLQENSVIANWILPRAQYGLTAVLGVGNEQAYRGRDGWLHYRPEVDYLTERGFLDEARLRQKIRSGNEETEIVQPNPIKAIVHFKRQLAARGIELVVMPTPVKPMIHPEKLSRRAKSSTNPLQNQSYEQFIKALRKEGITVFDCSEALVETKWRTGRPQYLQTDTHWTPEAVELAANQLAWQIKPRFSKLPQKNYVRGSAEAENLGDIAMMLKLPRGQRLYAKERVRIRPVKTADGAVWNPSRHSDILLLGDSFTNIYSMKGLGWGEAAGFAEQLSFFLGRPIDRIAMNAGGAYTARQQLQKDMARGKDRLAGKRLVIYQFAARELSHGDWKMIDLPRVKHETAALKPKAETAVAQEPAEEAVLSDSDSEQEETKPEIASESSEPDGQTKAKEITPIIASQETPEPSGQDKGLVIRGSVKAKTAPPKPGTVPYKDCIIALHLTGVKATSGSILENEIIVFVWGMRDNRWTSFASLDPGRVITLSLTPWENVESRYGSYNRMELDSDEALLLDLYWGE